MTSPLHQSRLASLAKRNRTIAAVARGAYLRTQRSGLWDTLSYRLKPVDPERPMLLVVGPWKTGTTTVATALADRQSSHETEVWTLYRDGIAWADGRIDLAELTRRLRVRDRMLGLRIESNALLVLVIEGLVAAFPDAHFVVTVRDPRSWLESWLNQEATVRGRQPWERLWQRFFTADPTPADNSLRTAGFFPLEGYLSYWAWHYQRVLDAVPSERLTVLRMQQLAEALPRLGAHVGLRAPVTPARANVRSEKIHRLDELVDSQHLDGTIERVCGPVNLLLERITSQTPPAVLAASERQDGI